MLEKIQYDDGLPVKVQVLKIREYPWHMHNDIQIIYVLEGEIDLKMTYTRYYLSKNHMHFIHSDDVHGMKGLTENNLVVVMSLNMDYFSQFYPELDTQVFTTKDSEDVATYKRQLAMKAHIFAIISELYGKKRGYKNRVKDLSLDLMDALYKDFRGFTVDRVTRSFEHMVSHDILQIDRVSRVVSLVYKNYPYKLSLAAIAEKENINTYYLSHLFRKQIGDSFRNFVSMVRVEMSEAQLLTTDTSISQISENVGFSNAKYYVENFREWFGCHPKEYRQLYKGQILGQAPVSIEELPLESINDVIDSYSEFPVFIGASSVIRSAKIDLKKEPMGTLSPIRHRLVPKKLYDCYDPYPQCLSMVREMLDPPYRLPQPSLYDSPQESNGLLTLNGMRKPQYYLYQLLSTLYETIVCAEDTYLLTKFREDYQLLFFNDSKEESQNYEFNFFKLSGSYQITERRLPPGESCISGWKQLNFKEVLTDQEFESIQAMSIPKTAYQITSARGSYTYSANLSAGEIVFVDLKKSPSA
ncbi:helix-turn-helix domain-containing protein [Anaerovorax odorimutans]|uniref:Helix-turn-helix domain-containing protein n=1 Tax=Anaerovorax odorimutans TaxID=109327 RepID=A0ABT1RN39_9FIRM|nr:helix-turn-helix domain-containing protein [Anaerovorax odorimutans]MCQ4636605.1 helix-turn-helix domain-containing protein [Anaerovorax odorimutans]